MRRVCDDTPPPIREINPNTPKWLAAIIARLQAKAPDDRFQSAAEVAEVRNQHLLQLQSAQSAPILSAECIPPAAEVEAVPVAVPEWVPPETPRRRWRKPLLVTAALVFLAFLGAMGYLFRSAFLGSRPDRPEQREAELAGMPSPAEAEQEELARQVRDKLAMYCYRCHGENGAVEGGFNYLMDRDQLVAHKKIRPEQPEKSRLLRRVAEGEMPPEGEKPRPGPEDIALLQRWIAAGAPAFGPSPASRTFVADSEGTQSIRDDLAKRKERDRRFTRYFTLTHLLNSGLSEDELQSYRNGLSKLLNSLSWKKTIAVPVPIDAAKTVLRIDLRDYGWTDTEWEALLAVYPYGIDDSSPEHQEEAAYTGTALAHLRGDWFVAHASRPPLYHQLLQLPPNERELEKLVHFNVEAHIRGERDVARAGFNDSGVSRNNRLIERHKTSYGAYWKSYDFAENTGAQNLFERPLGPGSDDRSFRHAGGEIIFNLPNGLQGYMLVNGKGERIDKGPTAIVSDPKRPDRAVENGLSCMACHSRGLNPKTDQIRAHVLANKNAFPKEETETILALYPPADVFADLLRKDTERFQAAAAATGAKVGATEPIMALAAQFEAPLDLRRAAAEVGLTPADFLANLEQSPEIGRAIGALKIDGGTVQRQTFVRVLTELHGKPLPNRTSTQAKDQADGKIYPPVPTQPVDPVKFHRIEQAAPVAFKPYLPAAESEVVTLPGAVADVAVGGGGRYLVFHLERSLAVFDVQEGKVVRQLPLAEEHAHFAAGATRLVVLYPGARVLQIWDLTRFVKERSSPFPGSMATGEIRQVCLGSASNGPLFVYLANEKRTLALNPATLETAEVRWRHWGPKNAYGPLHMRAAPDGDTLVGWSGGWAGAEMAFFREGIQHGSDNNIEFSMGLFALPSADGRRLFTPWAIVNRDGGPIKPPELANTYRVPAHEPGFFIALHSQGPYPHAPREKEPAARLPAVSQVVVYTEDGRWLFPLAAIDGLNAGTGLFWERRVHYYPRAGLLAVRIAPDRLLLRRVDLVKNLDKTGADYLVVVSRPPLAHPGSTWSYQLDVRAKAGAGKVALESGPEGLAVTPGGRMTWRVPDDYPNPAAAVKLTLRDKKGLEMLQQFSVIVAPAKH